jgi:putative transposase
MRYTTFRLTLDPTPAQAGMLARYAGASRFAYNQCLRFVTEALERKTSDPTIAVPWSGFDLINAFNAWKRSEAAGRSFVVSPDGTTTKEVTGLVWRHEICAQVFVEAAVDLGRALAAYEQGPGRQGQGTQDRLPETQAQGSLPRELPTPQ